MNCFSFFTKACTLTSLALALISGSAQALVIGYNVQSSGPEGICRILVREAPSGKLYAGCSSTLVAHDTLATAAHCVDFLQQGNFTVQIQCGYTGVNQTQLVIEKTHAGNNLYTKGVMFKEDLPVAEIFMDPQYDRGNETAHDVAKIQLAKPSRLSIVRLSTPTDQSLEGWKKYAPRLNPLQCKVAGYGLDNNLIAGNLRSARLNDYKMNFYPNVVQAIKGFLVTDKTQLGNISFMYNAGLSKFSDDDYIKYLSQILEKNQILDSTITFGDSGGPLFCRIGYTDDWSLSGIASTVDIAGPIKIGDGYSWTDIATWAAPHLDQASKMVWSPPTH